jgi:Cysteine-rich secretory protein family
MATQIATELEQQFVAAINAERAAAGLPPLKVEVHLNAAAQSHSDWMTENETLSHTGEDGSDATDRIGDAGFPLTGSWRTAENIAVRSISGSLGDDEVDSLHDGLMDSEGHRENILDPDVAYVGVGVSVGDIGGSSQDAVYVTQNFADTDGRVLVQEEDADGGTVLQAYQNGVPVGAPQVPDTPEEPDEPADPDEEESDSSSGGGCFVATAAYGSRSHPDVVDLRRFRDEVLTKHAAGRALIRAYWIVGPKMAVLVSPGRPSGRVARTFIAPLARLARARSGRRG